jgi:hypothetical protein
MSSWNNTIQTAPAIGENVQFIVFGHHAWLTGTYEGDCFRSRWATYSTAVVNLWRHPHQQADGSTPPRIKTDRVYWAERLRQLAEH